VGLFLLIMPFMVLPIMASIERISPNLDRAAQHLVEPRSRFQPTRHLVLW
jgi:ABC-type spermidine/putrescine transport system permease subunit I